MDERSTLDEVGAAGGAGEADAIAMHIDDVDAAKLAKAAETAQPLAQQDATWSTPQDIQTLQGPLALQELSAPLEPQTLSALLAPQELSALQEPQEPSAPLAPQEPLTPQEPPAPQEIQALQEPQEPLAPQETRATAEPQAAGEPPPARSAPRRDAPRAGVRARTVAVRHLYTDSSNRKGRKRKPAFRWRAASFALGALAGLALAAAIASFAPDVAYRLMGPQTQRQGAEGETVRMVEVMSVDAPYQAIYEQVAPCVVRVQVSEALLGPVDGFEDTYEFSGIVVRSDGHIITDSILLEDIIDDGNGDSIRIDVTLPGGAVHEAELVGYDTATSIAVIKIESDGLPTAQLGDSDGVRAGELVVAVGSVDCIEDATWVTNGIVNGIYRMEGADGGNAYSLIQTNAAMSYSSIGGALVNSRGQVVGVNSGGISAESGFAGLNFAVPINDARAAAERFIGPIAVAVDDGARGGGLDGPGLGAGADASGGADPNAGAGDGENGGSGAGAGAGAGADAGNGAGAGGNQSGAKAYCGIVVDPSFDRNYNLYRQQDPGMPKGAMVFSVEPMSGAFAGGVESGDIITELDGVSVASAFDFDEALGALSPGQTVTVVVYRDGKRMSFGIELSEAMR